VAEESFVFRDAHAVNPTCSPSRVGLLTGSHPSQNGMFGLAHKGHSLADPSRHLTHFLKHHGYTTALSGVQHEHDHRAPKEELRRVLAYDRLLVEEGGVPERKFLPVAIWVVTAIRKPVNGG